MAVFQKQILQPADEYLIAGDEVVVSKAWNETYMPANQQVMRESRMQRKLPVRFWGAGRKRMLETAWHIAIPPYIGIYPSGFLDRVSAPDSNISTGVAGASWYEVPGILWDVVEQISWTMLGKPRASGCIFRPVGMRGE